MKKLTAGIFATIMGLTAVNAYAASEKIATTNYVKGAMTAAQAAAVAAVENKGYATTTQAQGYATEALNTAKSFATSEANAAKKAAQDYTDEVVGIVPEGSENVVAYVDKKTNGIASEGTVSELDTRVKTIEDDYLKAAAIADMATQDDVATAKSAAVSEAATAAAGLYETKTNAAATYETIANADLVRGRVTALETADKTFLTKDAASTTYETSAHATATYATINTVNGIDGRVDALETAGYAKTADLTGTATVTNAVLTGVKLDNGVLSATGSMEIDDNYTDDNQPAA